MLRVVHCVCLCLWVADCWIVLSCGIGCGGLVCICLRFTWLLVCWLVVGFVFDL